MKNSTIRIVVILAMISILGISITQFIWFKKAFDLRNNQFNYSVNTALKNVGENITRYNNSPPLQINPVSQVSGNYFVVRVNDAIDANLLEQLLVNQFRQRSIDSNFEYGIYDCSNEKMVYGNYVSMNSKERSSMKGELPKWENDTYYFGVFFPGKSSYLLGQMNIWLFSTAVLLIVILFFSYALFIILKQKRLSEIQKDFINNMTHEFKTPLSTISVSSEVLSSKDIIREPDRLNQYAGIIQDESSRLKLQVERILQMAKMENKKIELDKEEADLHQLIRESVLLYENKFKEKGGQILTDLDAEKTSASVDKLHFTSTIHNLIDNGLKYSGNIPEMQVSTENENNNLIIRFKDNGIGIEKKYQKQIFDKFFRVPTGNLHDAKGFGLGLNYAKKIVRAHHGSISVESRPGQDSVFKIQIPLT